MNAFHYVNIFDTKGIEYLVVMAFMVGMFLFVRALAAHRLPVSELLAHAEIDPLSLAEGAFIAPGHTVSRLTADGSLRLGAGAMPLYMLGSVDKLELADPGEIKAGEPIAVLHSGDRTIGLPAPSDGTIAEVNTSLAADPALLADATSDDRWLVRMRPASLDETLGTLRFAAKGRAWLEGEMSRLTALVDDVILGARGASTMADGGMPIQGIAVHLDPETWEALQGRFFSSAEQAPPADAH